MKNNFEKKSIYNIVKLFFFLIIIFLISPNIILSQTNEQKKGNPPSPTANQEVKDDDYIPDLRESQERSPAYEYSMNHIVTSQVNVDGNGQNIVGDAANEPSIAVDPNDRNRIAIGWRQFTTVNSNFRQAGYGFTTNGGQTWTFPGVIEPGVFRSDPVLDTDVDGNFYYNSLSINPYTCYVFKSIDGGSSWDDGTFAQGGDKQWMTIDKINGPGIGHIYAFWTSSLSLCNPGFFTRSTDGGGSFEDCITIPNDPRWGTLAVGPGGELYIGGSTGSNFLVAKSLNAQNSGEIVTWDMATVVDLGGSISYGGGPNPGGLLGQTIVAVDTSDGAYHGNVYLLCSVDRYASTDPADVMFVRSTDGGVNWSSPVRINDDPGTSAYQWFGTMSVAPNGRIDVVWLDTRDNPSRISALYYSNSKDGGVTWSQNERLSDYFDSNIGWPQQNKMGDYFDMVSDSSGASLAWAATFNGEQDVYYSRITDTTGTVPVELLSFSASVEANVVTLYWSTATELNNHVFEIERSSDKTTWRLIGFREGKGTTSEPQQYFYSDKLSDIASSILYYRLKQIDFNGSFVYSNILEVAIPPAVFSLSQNYPNPFNPSTTFRYSIPNPSMVTIKVFDILGNEIEILLNEEKPAGTYEITWYADDLPSGVYFYQLKAGSFVGTRKTLLLR